MSSNDPRAFLAQASKDAMVQRGTLKQATPPAKNTAVDNQPPGSRATMEPTKSSPIATTANRPNPSATITVTKSVVQETNPSSPARTPRSKPVVKSSEESARVASPTPYENSPPNSYQSVPQKTPSQPIQKTGSYNSVDSPNSSPSYSSSPNKTAQPPAKPAPVPPASTSSSNLNAKAPPPSTPFKTATPSSPPLTRGSVKPGEESNICDRCEESAATVMCVECGKPYCDECSVEVHSRGKWATHTTYPRGQNPPAKATNTPVSPTPTARNPTPSKVATAPPPNTSSSPSTSSPSTTSSSPATTSPNSSSSSYTPATQNNTMTRSVGIRRPSIAATTPPTPSQPKVVLDTAKEEAKLPSLKEAVVDEVIDTLMTASLSYLFQGVFLKDETNTTYYYRLNEDQTLLEFCKVANPQAFEKSPKAAMPDKQTISVVEIVDIIENINSKPSSFTFRFKSNSTKTVSSENRIEFVHVYDGLRCLIGLEMQSAEMKSSMTALTELRAVLQMYPPPPPPSKPSTYNFVTS